MSNTVSRKIIEFLARQSPGAIVNRDSIRNATGLDDKQVYSGMYHLQKRGQIEVEEVARGSVWRIKSVGKVAPEKPTEAKPTTTEPADDGNLMLLEVIERAGTILIARDGDGGLYTVKRIGKTS